MTDEVQVKKGVLKELIKKMYGLMRDGEESASEPLSEDAIEEVIEESAQPDEEDCSCEEDAEEPAKKGPRIISVEMLRMSPKKSTPAVKSLVEDVMKKAIGNKKR